ncbi:MAG: hypothetical protein Q9187_008288, partial [Circinaria calcarea]
PIVPAIPRALERRPKKDNVKTSPTLDVSTQQVEQGSVRPQANSSGKAPVPDGRSDYRGFSFLAEDRGLDLDLGALKIEDDESTASRASPSKRSTQDFGIERHGFQLPPPFYPAHSRHIAESATLLEAEERGRSHTSFTFSQPFDYGIRFGGHVESDQSSPTLPPSAISTAFPQPTPPSDVTSSPNHSAYQGYGHVHHPSVSSLPSNPTSQPHKYPDGQPMFVPLDYSYDADPVSYKHSTPYITNSSQQPFEPSATFFRDQPAQYLPPTQDSLPATQHGVGECLIEPAETIQHNTNGTFLTALTSHLSQHFDYPEYADCELEIHVCDESAELKLHALLIGRSPTMRGLFDSATGPSETGRTRLSLSTFDGFVTVPAIVSALRVCYGQPPSDGLCSSLSDGPNTLGWTGGLQSNEASLTYRTDSALAYFAAGHLLQLHEVCSCAIPTIENCLAYETLEKILSFAIDGFTYPIDETSHRNPSNRDEREDLITLGRLSYAPYSGFVLIAAVHFIVVNFPISFVLDTSAPTFMSLNQFPVTESPSSRVRPPKSRLSSIRFGDFPLETLELPKEEDTILSSTFFSIPFLVLMHILDGLGDSMKQRILRPVIEERERRRLLVSQKRKASEVEEECGIWINGSWEEYIVGTEPNLTATRRWLGA